MTDESDQMMLLLQELAVLKESKKKTPELQRRKDSCGTYAGVLAERRQAFMQREMYGKHDNP